jgi:hypothetical protein
MSQAFKADSVNFAGLLSGLEKPQLVVPPFQRGYSWEKKHVDAFWKDLVKFQEEKSDGVVDKYFLGPIVTLERGGRLEVLDGQQRIATATILFAALRDAATSIIGTSEAEKFSHAIQTTFIAKDDAGDHVGFCLELGEADKEFFREHIQRFPGPDASPPVKLKSHKNIAVAKKLLQTAVNGMLVGLAPHDQMKRLRSLRDVIRTELVMTSIPVDDEREAFRIFETLNDRGLKLSVPDLLLNYLMKTAPTDADRSAIRKYWNQMLDRMGRRNIGHFLRHVWVSQFGDVKKDLFGEIKTHFESNGTVSLEFAKASQEHCHQYCELLDFSDELGAARRHVRALIKNLDCFSALPLLLSAYSSLSPSGFEHVCRLTLVFVVRYSLVRIYLTKQLLGPTLFSCSLV